MPSGVATQPGTVDTPFFVSRTRVDDTGRIVSTENVYHKHTHMQASARESMRTSIRGHRSVLSKEALALKSASSICDFPRVFCLFGSFFFSVVSTVSACLRDIGGIRIVGPYTESARRCTHDCTHLYTHDHTCRKEGGVQL